MPNITASRGVASRSRPLERDAALVRISRARRWMFAGAAALSAGFAALVSSLTPRSHGACDDEFGASDSLRAARTAAPAKVSTRMPPLATPATSASRAPRAHRSPAGPSVHLAGVRPRQSSSAPARPIHRSRRPPQPRPPRPADAGTGRRRLRRLLTERTGTCPSFESSVTFPALGSVAFVAVADPRGLADARAAVEETVVEFDLACSRFRDDSELSALNAAAGSAEVRVGPLLLEAVSCALRAARLTDGDVDPTIGEALIALGYDRDFDELAGAGSRPPVSIASVPGWRTVRVDPERSTIRVPARRHARPRRDREGARRRSGGRARGGVRGLRRARRPRRRHRRRAGPRRRGRRWRVRVTDDHRAGVDAPGQWISLRSGGLATSSTTVRRWQTGSGVAHHLIDPATGRSAPAAWRTVSVTAASCLDANIASTAAIVRGVPAVDWLASLALPSRLVSASGAVTHVAGWPPEGDDLHSAAVAIGAGS